MHVPYPQMIFEKARAGSMSHANPTAEWIARQVTEAFPWDEAPRYLIRDRDRVYGAAVTHRLRAMGIRDKPIAPGSPWQNGSRNPSVVKFSGCQTRPERQQRRSTKRRAASSAS
jgi:hypothetical protein